MSELDLSLLDLFREEVVSHTGTLATGLVELESDPANPQRIEPLMRAAHSIKGAARIVGVEAAVGLAHVLEDALVAAQHGRIRLSPANIDVLLRGSDLLATLGQLEAPGMKNWGATHAAALAALTGALLAMTQEQPVPPPVVAPAPPAAPPARALSPSPRVIIPQEPILPGDEHPMYDLFREELRQQALALTQGLERLEQQPGAADVVHRLLQAARAIRAAARIVGLDTPAEVASRMEGLLSALERGDTAGAAGSLPVMREGVYLLAGLIEQPAESATDWVKHQLPALQTILARLDDVALVPAEPPSSPPPALLPRGPIVPAKAEPAALPPTAPAEVEVEIGEGQIPPPESAEAVVRVTAQSLNRLMSLAGESLVQARWLQPFATALLKLKKQQDQLAALLDTLGATLADGSHGDTLDALVAEIHTQSSACRQVLADRMGEFEDHAAQAEDLNSRLYREVIVSRMRPFSDGARGLPRLVRDMARKLGKQARLEIQGQSTEVDRDILERLEAPLMHLVRNAVDHGIEAPDQRRAAGKPEQGVIRLDVRHRAGTLAITVSDDGSGIDLDQLRRKIVDRGLSPGDMVASMNEAELLEFLFLPGFTTTKSVTEYSGRGVGLDVVQDTIRKVGGAVRLSTALGRGTSFHLQLPITLSVLRAVVVEIAGEPYAFSHNRIDRLLRVPLTTISSVEHRQFVNVDGHNVGLVLAAQLLDLPSTPTTGSDLPVLLLSDETGQYGLIVEAFRGEQDLVVRPLDPRLGKVPNISAAALLDDGSPVLIADIEDLIRSMDHFIQSGSLRRCLVVSREEKRRKRVLVVDDSITVREVERQLLRNAGYDVDVAVDGKDGWNQVRSGGYDLMVTDIDMPRMTGLELVKAVRDLDAVKDLPVVVVSYKDREDDRLRGMEVGANFYLTKSSFHDNTFLRAVADLIGEA